VEPSASATSRPQLLTPTATATSAAGTISFQLYDELELAVGQAARLAGTGIELSLLEAHGPAQGCFDCPIGATLRVRSGAESQELSYSFSANALPEVLAKLRRKAAFGFAFIAVRIVEGSLTIRVEPGGT